MLLKFGSQEKLQFHVTAFDPPAGQHVRDSFKAGDALAAEVFSAVAIGAARKQDFQEQAVLLKATRRKDQPAINENSIAPDIATGEQHDARVFVVTSPRTTSHHPDATKKEGRNGDHRRANAPPATHSNSEL
ncbi:MAG: hypothetical protein WAK90_10510 [Pseudolabrys sp.]